MQRIAEIDNRQRGTLSSGERSKRKPSGCYKAVTQHYGGGEEIFKSNECKLRLLGMVQYIYMVLLCYRPLLLRNESE